MLSDLQFLKGTLEMEHPNKFINSFSGVITLEGKAKLPTTIRSVYIKYDKFACCRDGPRAHRTSERVIERMCATEH